ncbi:unnamed protein product, partial [Gongylonema pulchrum]|uniref:CSP n=1 Tax=Gongylonema pulchrum TaxID=637853 RepID=A0A183D5E3_9BILA
MQSKRNKISVPLAKPLPPLVPAENAIWVKVYGEANPNKTNEKLLDVQAHTEILHFARHTTTPMQPGRTVGPFHGLSLSSYGAPTEAEQMAKVDQQAGAYAATLATPPEIENLYGAGGAVVTEAGKPTTTASRETASTTGKKETEAASTSTYTTTSSVETSELTTSEGIFESSTETTKVSESAGGETVVGTQEAAKVVTTAGATIAGVSEGISMTSYEPSSAISGRTETATTAGSEGTTLTEGQTTETYVASEIATEYESKGIGGLEETGATSTAIGQTEEVRISTTARGYSTTTESERGETLESKITGTRVTKSTTSGESTSIPEELTNLITGPEDFGYGGGPEITKEQPSTARISGAAGLPTLSEASKPTSKTIEQPGMIEELATTLGTTETGYEAGLTTGTGSTHGGIPVTKQETTIKSAVSGSTLKETATTAEETTSPIFSTFSEAKLATIAGRSTTLAATPELPVSSASPIVEETTSHAATKMVPASLQPSEGFPGYGESYAQTESTASSQASTTGTGLPGLSKVSAKMLAKSIEEATTVISEATSEGTSAVSGITTEQTSSGAPSSSKAEYSVPSKEAPELAGYGMEAAESTTAISGATVATSVGTLARIAVETTSETTKAESTTQFAQSPTTSGTTESLKSSESTGMSEEATKPSIAAGITGLTESSQGTTGEFAESYEIGLTESSKATTEEGFSLSKETTELQKSSEEVTSTEILATSEEATTSGVSGTTEAATESSEERLISGEVSVTESQETAEYIQEKTTKPGEVSAEATEAMTVGSTESLTIYGQAATTVKESTESGSTIGGTGMPSEKATSGKATTSSELTVQPAGYGVQETQESTTRITEASEAFT